MFAVTNHAAPGNYLLTIMLLDLYGNAWAAGRISRFGDELMMSPVERQWRLFWGGFVASPCGDVPHRFQPTSPRSSSGLIKSRPVTAAESEPCFLCC